MTLPEFNALSLTRQLMEVLATGTHLATRYEDGGAATVYQLPGGLFVELGHDGNRLRVYAFTDTGKLDYYAVFVKLPDWIPDTE